MEKNITSQEILEFHNEYYDNYLERLKIGRRRREMESFQRRCVRRGR
ncbi:MAG: hypothetical protein ACLVJO_01315 [[Clostridium] scindens]